MTPPRTLKLVFHVEDPATKEIVVEKSQMVFALVADHAAMVEHLHSTDAKPASVLALAELARNHTAELVAATAAWRDAADSGSQLPPEDIERARLACGTIMGAKKFQDEIFMAVGDLLRRVIQIRLRDWARVQLAGDSTITIKPGMEHVVASADEMGRE